MKINKRGGVLINSGGGSEKNRKINKRLPLFIRHLRVDISWTITTESSPLHIAAGLEPGIFGFQAQVANH